MNDAAARRQFIAALGWGDAAVLALSGDASTRRFERLARPDGQTAVLISSAPGGGDTEAFVRIARLLREAGLSAPEVYGADAGLGLILAEDFGDICFGRLPRAAKDPAAFCAAGVEVLIALHRRFDPLAAAAAGLPDFTPAVFLNQAALFLDSYLPFVAGAPDETTQRAFRTAWAAVLPLAYRVPRSLLLRDYHLGNIMRLPLRQGVAACGLLDFQDAGIGPVTYDLVSLLEDVRLPTDAAAPALYAHYRAAFPAVDPADFARSCAVLGALRQCRILAVFARLAEAQGRRDYLRFLPRAWQLLDRRLGEPALAPVAAWFAAHLPAARRIPAALAMPAG
ncbi:MAG TPA: phosphotransferase [Candidatus Sulfotelmatobacter sp.]|nr:phosphotransferase [Candidatus Sulfotelmatobacter sp.]